MSNRKNISPAPLAAAAIVLHQLRGLVLQLGPYLIALLLPGGSLLALALFLYRRRNPLRDSNGLTPRLVPVPITRDESVRNRTRHDWRH
jgi:hypothetical protein